MFDQLARARAGRLMPTLDQINARARGLRHAALRQWEQEASLGDKLRKTLACYRTRWDDLLVL